MQLKLKSVFRRSSKKESRDQDKTSQYSESTSPRSRSNGQQNASLDEPRSRQSSDSQGTDTRRHSRSRPLSSAYDSHHANDARGTQPLNASESQHESSQLQDDPIASNYRAYLPVLSPVNDADNEGYMSMGGDTRLIAGESEKRHEEDVANRNIDRNNPPMDSSTRHSLPSTPVLDDASQGRPVLRHVADSDMSKDSGVPSTGTGGSGKYSIGRDLVTKGGLVDGIRPHVETSAHERNQWKNTQWPKRGAQEEPRAGLNRRKTRTSESDDDDFKSFSDDSGQDIHRPVQPLHGGDIPVDGRGDVQKQIEHLLDGVVDLRNTVDEDKEVHWAPAVEHQVVKPHEHEVIQHKIYREIHNYEYYHHLQPVYDLEVLPPRHWIPNPNGEGLIEISADELPSRTGENRRWKIVREDLELPAQAQRVWRTEPQIIEHPTTITEEGFERKETTIIYPPTLQDLSDYEGLVQPVHFDHKTGKRWLGELTTMQNLKQQSGQVTDALSMKELGDALPRVPSESDVPELSHNSPVKRKPVGGPIPARLGDLSGSKPVAAVA